eukprot:8091802-Ditylum_brightwellii.AAC.2
MVKEPDSPVGAGNTPQGQRQLFGLYDDGKSCLKHVTTSSRLSLESAKNAVAAKPTSKVFLECCSFTGFIPFFLIAY